jgi:hypothetical protein
VKGLTAYLHGSILELCLMPRPIEPCLFSHQHHTVLVIVTL